MIFLDLAALASNEFSMDFFNKNFAHLIFMFNKETNKTVAMRFAKYIL